MFLTVICLQIIVRVLSGAPLQNVHVDGLLLKWTPASEEKNVTYSVQFISSDSDVWTDVPACLQICDHQCDVSSIEAEDQQGCARLRVQAKRHGQETFVVEACSRHADLCSPEVSLTSRPGSLTVHLSRNHSLAMEHEDHAKHRVFYGQEGEPLKRFREDTVSSVSILGLQEGHRFCVKVQYVYFDKLVRLPSCPQCELIPNTVENSEHVWILPTLIPVLLILSTGMFYVFVFHRRRIKHSLQESRYRIPVDFFLETLPEHHPPFSACSSCEKPCDVISSVTPLEVID